MRTARSYLPPYLVHNFNLCTLEHTIRGATQPVVKIRSLFSSTWSAGERAAPSGWFPAPRGRCDFNGGYPRGNLRRRGAQMLKSKYLQNGASELTLISSARIKAPCRQGTIDHQHQRVDEVAPYPWRPAPQLALSLARSLFSMEQIS